VSDPLPLCRDPYWRHKHPHDGTRGVVLVTIGPDEDAMDRGIVCVPCAHQTARHWRRVRWSWLTTVVRRG
jgi:hypothetical protein